MKKWVVNASKLAFVASLIVFACSKNSSAKKKSPLLPLDQTQEEEWGRRAWVGKASRVLHHGVELSPAQVEAFLTKSPVEIVKALMDDPRFGFMVLDFNLYFLGIKNEYAEVGSYLTFASRFSSAVSSAQEVVKGGDYFKLFDYEQPLFMSGLPRPYASEENYRLATNELRTKIIQTIKKNLQEKVEWINNHPEADRETTCKDLGNMLFNKFAQLRFPFEVSSAFFESGEWITPIFGLCYSDEDLPDYKTKLVAQFQKIDENLSQGFVDYLNSLDEKSYVFPSVLDLPLPRLDLLKIEAPKGSFFGKEAWAKLTNSSTNYNRKRASYVLKRFFCDDLTPINVSLPSMHAEDKHASDPNCQSCHYKLDPMAGFFRNIGSFGNDFSDSETITFDDMAEVDRQKYISNWRAAQGIGHEWEIGYIRSATDVSKNSYADGKAEIESLLHLLKTAPEVKQCIVRRMFQYLVSEQQTVDAGYLNWLTESFVEESKTNSSTAFKNLITKIVTSQSFGNMNPNLGECYDQAPGSKSDNRPCQIVFILDNNCVSCHSGPAPKKGLSLDKWKKLDGGYGFPQVNSENQKQVSRLETFQKMYDRITQKDPAKTPMPPGYISSDDREKLVLWLDGILKDEKN